ncbi:MAG: riboflavin synthase [Planctomycetota bacterium]
MFTGIVESTGRVAVREPSATGERLVIEPGSGWAHGPLAGGESICISGCCLTLVEGVPAGAAMAFDVIPETLEKTTLGGLVVGSRVNLERSATAETLLGGHVMQGHVEGTGRVTKVVRPEDAGSGGEWRTRIETPPALMPCVVPKGSVAIEGVSLTVAAVSVSESWFEVALIPTTLDMTTLGERAVGDGVNLETDVMARTIVHALRHYGEQFGVTAPGGR